MNLCVSERWSRLEYKQGRRRRERKRESKATGMKRPTWDEVTAEMLGSGVPCECVSQGSFSQHLTASQGSTGSDPLGKQHSSNCVCCLSFSVCFSYAPAPSSCGVYAQSLSTQDHMSKPTNTISKRCTRQDTYLNYCPYSHTNLHFTAKVFVTDLQE